MGGGPAGHERLVAARAPLPLALSGGSRLHPASHTAIVGTHAGVITNLVDHRAKPAQDAMLTIARTDPARTLADARKLSMPRHHDVRREDVNLRRLGAVLAVAHERELRDFAELLLVEHLGPRTLQSLALIAERWSTARQAASMIARFSFAHGGKRRPSVPVPLRTYDESIDVLRRSLDAARLGDRDKLDGMTRLRDRFVRGVETHRSPEADFDATLAHERAISKSIGGRTVLDERPAR
jgi:hypothetical protein